MAYSPLWILKNYSRLLNSQTVLPLLLPFLMPALQITLNGSIWSLVVAIMSKLPFLMFYFLKFSIWSLVWLSLLPSLSMSSSLPSRFHRHCAIVVYVIAIAIVIAILCRRHCHCHHFPGGGCLGALHLHSLPRRPALTSEQNFCDILLPAAVDKISDK